MIKTKRLSIEVLRSEHADLVFEALQDKQIYTYVPESAPISVDALRTRYSQLVKGPNSGRKERWLNWIVFSADGQVPLGNLQATILFDESLSLVGYTVFPPFWGQGFATEGVAWLLQHLYTNEGVPLIEAHIDVRNTASLALVRRLGFSHIDTVLSPEGPDHVFQKQLLG